MPNKLLQKNFKILSPCLQPQIFFIFFQIYKNRNFQKVNITHQRLSTPKKKKKTKNGDIPVWEMKILVWIYELLSLKQKQANYNWKSKPSSLE